MTLFSACSQLTASKQYGSFDITYNRNASLPTAYETSLFNQPWVQVELGVPLNYTRGSDQVEAAFLGLTGDIMRYGLSHLGHLLDNGVNVAMANGDRDFRCNCESPAMANSQYANLSRVLWPKRFSQHSLRLS